MICHCIANSAHRQPFFFFAYNKNVKSTIFNKCVCQCVCCSASPYFFFFVFQWRNFSPTRQCRMRIRDRAAFAAAMAIMQLANLSRILIIPKRVRRKNPHARPQCTLIEPLRIKIGVRSLHTNAHKVKLHKNALGLVAESERVRAPRKTP